MSIYTCSKCKREFDSVKVKRFMQDPENTDRSGPRVPVCAVCANIKAGKVVEASKKKFPDFAVGVKHETVRQEIVEAAAKERNLPKEDDIED
jgi:hypothetical protein